MERDRITDIYQASELHRAAARGDATQVEALVRDGSCVDAVDRYGYAHNSFLGKSWSE